LDPEAQQTGGELIAQFAADMQKKHGFETSYLNVGGGLGVKYLDEHEPIAVEEYCRLVASSVAKGLEGSGLQPILGQEPGRSLVAESGVTLYEVGVVKTVPSPTRGTRTYVSVDGGLADNPRPAMYGARYTVERVVTELGTDANRNTVTPQHRNTASPSSELRAPSSQVTATVSGRHCETDTLFEDVLLPADTAPGDLLQVLCTGAYNCSMASNYNRYPRPATALIRENGSHVLIQRRDTWDEMVARESVPEDLRS
jgi:diaminopimelate decarboxylase